MEKYKQKYNESPFIDFDLSANNIKKMVNRNEHGQAIESLAKLFGFKQYEKVINHINAIADILREMPHKLIEYRDSLLNEMLDLIGRKYGKEVKNKFYMVF